MNRVVLAAAVLAGVCACACSANEGKPPVAPPTPPADVAETSVVADAAVASVAAVADAAVAPVADAAVAPVAPAGSGAVDAAVSKPWTFAVMSDLHMPRRNLKVVPEATRAVAAIAALRPRFVVVTGDHTNGGERDSPATVAASAKWWKVFADLLRPLRDAGIPVLPVAGNHDSYLPGQRAHYAATFADLTAWAAPLVVNAAVPAGDKVELDRPPFSYSIDVDGVHLSLAHVITQGLHREVSAWLAGDLAKASGAKLRLVFGHVPMSSVIQAPNRGFVATLGAILETGRAAAYIAGHEHIVWDEDVMLPRGGTVRQVLVGCSSGFYNWSPSADSRKRAGCARATAGAAFPLRCRMPNTGGEFELAPNAPNQNRVIQHQRTSFTVITIDRGAIVAVEPMAVDGAGRARRFYLDPAGR